MAEGREVGSKNKKTLLLLERLNEELDAIVEAMKLKDKNTEDYRTLVDAFEKIHKQIELKTGGATERIITINFDSAFENEITFCPKTDSPKQSAI